MSRSISLVPAVFGLLLFPALGAELPLSILGRTELVCPVCDQTFTTVVCKQSNTREGVDRDLFARALGPQPEFYRISTCPKCGYSGYLADFDAETELPADVRNRILGEPGLELPSSFTPESDPRELDATDRYRLAIQCYQWRGRSDEALGWLRLRASWVERESGSMLPPDDRLARVMTFIERWRPTMQRGENQTDIELRLVTRVSEAVSIGRFNRYQKPYVELALAMILRRHGENRQAESMLDRLSDHDEFSEELRAGIHRMLASIRRERAHQWEAVTHFERALLARQISPRNRGPACYLLGELYRRLGREQDAVRWFDNALSDAALPEDLRAWATEQRTWCED